MAATWGEQTTAVHAARMRAIDSITPVLKTARVRKCPRGFESHTLRPAAGTWLDQRRLLWCSGTLTATGYADSMPNGLRRDRRPALALRRGRRGAAGRLAARRPSSGTAGGRKSSRSWQRDFASSHPTCAATTCLLRPPRPARKHRARQPLALLPALPARRPPGLHARGDRSLHRGVVTARVSQRDDQLLPVLGADLTQEGRSGASPDLGADLSSGGARSLPRLRASRVMWQATHRRRRPGATIVERGDWAMRPAQVGGAAHCWRLAALPGRASLLLPPSGRRLTPVRGLPGVRSITDRGHPLPSSRCDQYRQPRAHRV
jgi:hypothetical protein